MRDLEFCILNFSVLLIFYVKTGLAAELGRVVWEILALQIERKEQE
jgi:hypothetical protein